MYWEPAIFTQKDLLFFIIENMLIYSHTYEMRAEFAIMVAKIHEMQIEDYLRGLDCPTEQKLALLDAIIEEIEKA